MDRNELINKIEDLELVMVGSRHYIHDYHNYNYEGPASFYEELLDEFSVHVWALRSIGDPYPWEKVLELQPVYEGIGARLPNVTDEELDTYVHMGNLLAVLLEDIEVKY